MPMDKQVVGKDSDGNDVLMVWGDDLNWAHGFAKSRDEQREYYRAHGRGDAHYAVVREVSKEFKYWYVAIYVDGKTTHLPTEFMSAYEGKEVCQIFESERARDILKNAHARIEGKTKNE
jgi:hypothetical protein